MSISFQSTSASTGSRSDGKVRIMQHPGGPQPGFLGGIFQKRERKPSRSDDVIAGGSGGGGGVGTSTGGGGAGGPFGRSTEV